MAGANLAYAFACKIFCPYKTHNFRSFHMSVSSAKTFKLSAAALALGFSAAASAQSTVSIYGLLDMSVGQFQTSGAPKVWKAESGNMSTSFLGFKGTEDLGGGLKAKFAFEHFLRADVGGAGRFNGDAFWARSAYVGLQGDFGSTVIGRNTTPLFVSTLIFNAFGDSFGFAPSIRQYFLGPIPGTIGTIVGDTAWNNSIAYSSPNFSGASVNLLANLGEGAAGATGKNLGANVLFFSGPFAGTLAWQQVKNGVFPIPAGFKAQDTLQAGVSYDLGVAKLFGQLGNVKTKATADVKTSLYQFGASAPIGGGKLLASYGNAKRTVGTSDLTNKTLTLGYDYNLSKNTDVYGVFMNDKTTGLSSGTTLAAGIRMRF
jgi:predicted porin